MSLFGEGNSIFVDDAFEPYDNQWVFLSTVKKVPAVVAHGLADGYVVPGMGGGKSRWSSEKNTVIQNDLATQNGATVADSAAPETAAAQRLTSLQVDVTLDGMVQLRKYQLSQPLLADLSQMAAMANSELFLKQCMHQRIYAKTTPRFLWFGEENDDTLCLPRGCQGAAVPYLCECDCEVDLYDEWAFGRAIHSSFVGTLREG